MASTIAPAYVDDYHHIHATSSSNRGALIRQPPPVIEEPVVEHEHHHLHHHIDHGSVAPPRSIVSGVHSHGRRPSVGRQYSYDDLDVRERRYTNGTTVSQIHHEHAHDTSRRRRRRHRHRSGRFEHETTRYTRSEIDLALRGDDYDYHHDDVTIVDVPPGTRRLKVNLDSGSSRSHRDYDIDWRREHGIRRSRGLGNELWTEITKDLISREALEELGYQFEETDYFYYVFEYLDQDEISELRDLTEDIRRERVRELQYESITGGSQRMSSVPRIMASSNRMYERDIIDSDTRTEIIIENGSSRGGGRSYRRGRYYN